MHKDIPTHLNICKPDTSISVNLCTCMIAYTDHTYIYFCIISYINTFILAYLQYNLVGFGA